MQLFAPSIRCNLAHPLFRLQPHEPALASIQLGMAVMGLSRWGWAEGRVSLCKPALASLALGMAVAPWHPGAPTSPHCQGSFHLAWR